MSTDDAFALHAKMRQLGIPGAVTPRDPQDPAGQWLVVDEAGQDITDRVLARVAKVGPPRRGFVVAR